MLKIQRGAWSQNCQGISRRTALQAGFLGLAGLTLAVEKGVDNQFDFLYIANKTHLFAIANQESPRAEAEPGER